MGKYSGSSRSFNTLKHSNRAERSKRKTQSKYLILSICVVVILILLALAVFLVMALAHKGAKKPSADNGEDIAFKTVSIQNTSVREGTLLLVNAEHEYIFPTDGTGAQVSANDVVTTPGCVKGTAVRGNGTALAAYDAMMKKYVETFGESDIWLVEAFRTKEAQAGKQFAPGFSDHHTGLLLRLEKKDGSDPEASNWLYQNCYKYGFVVRYPSGKKAYTGVDNYTNAFRYVGVAHATYMYEHNLCLEEYIPFLQNNYSSGELLRVTGADGTSYAIYSVTAATGQTATDVSLPSNHPYEISGNNAGGFIVTVDMTKKSGD